MSIIYQTINLINSKYYVGQHYTSADDGYLGSGKIIELSIKKYGKENFKREILEHVTSANVNEREIFWIAELSATDKNIGYNITNGGEGLKGFKHSDETKNHISLMQKGKKVSDETKKKISIANKGKTHSEETKEKLSIANQGQIPWILGKTHSEETRKKLSIVNKGKKASEELKLKLSKIHTERSKSKEYRKNMSIVKNQYLYILEKCNEKFIFNYYDLKSFCFENEMNVESITNNCRLNRNYYKDWKIYRIILN